MRRAGRVRLSVDNFKFVSLHFSNSHLHHLTKEREREDRRTDILIRYSTVICEIRSSGTGKDFGVPANRRGKKPGTADLKTGRRNSTVNARFIINLILPPRSRARERPSVRLPAVPFNLFAGVSLKNEDRAYRPAPRLRGPTVRFARLSRRFSFSLLAEERGRAEWILIKRSDRATPAHQDFFSVFFRAFVSPESVTYSN